VEKLRIREKPEMARFDPIYGVRPVLTDWPYLPKVSLPPPEVGTSSIQVLPGGIGMG
jgi:hypothetical protein